MNQSELFIWFSCILGGFLSGSIMFSSIIPQRILKKDICTVSEDHNPGAANVFIQCGSFWGFICLFLDMLKGYVPVMIACHYLDLNRWLFAIVLAAPVLGHAIAPFHQFHGGKCIATAFGELLALFPFNQIGILLAVIYILFSTVIKIRPNRIRSIITFGIFGLLSVVFLIPRNQFSIAFGCLLISLIAIIKHTKYFSC